MKSAFSYNDNSFKFHFLEKILNSNPYRNAVLPDVTTCPSCKYVELCKEFGMLRPSETGKDMRAEIPYCKRVLDIAAP